VAGAGDGTAMTSGTPGSFITTRRPSFVGLSDKTLGSIQAGSQYSPGFLFTGYGDVAGNNTVGTNFSQATVISSVADAVGVTNSTAAYKINAQSIRYDSPSFMGLVGSLYTVTPSTAASGAGKVNALNLAYTAGKFEAQAMYEVKIISTNSALITTATAVKHTSSGIGGGYDFGFAKARVTYQKGELASQINGSSSGSNGIVSVTKISAIAPVTPAIDVFGAYMLLSENSVGTMYGAANTQKSATGISIGSTYKFSKRTNIYATYTAVENNSNAAFKADGSATGITATNGVVAGNDPKVINIGMRHSF